MGKKVTILMIILFVLNLNAENNVLRLTAYKSKGIKGYVYFVLLSKNSLNMENFTANVEKLSGNLSIAENTTLDFRPVTTENTHLFYSSFNFGQNKEGSVEIRLTAEDILGQQTTYVDTLYIP